MLGVAFGFFAGNRPASAAPAKVALIHDREPNVVQQQTVTRLRAELTAAGFEVTDVERGSDDIREATEAEPASGVFATIAIAPKTSGAADIWVADRITGKTVVRHVAAPATSSRDVAAVLAVRAVELLQASLLEAIEPPPRDQRATSAVDATSSALESAKPVPTDVAAWMQTRRAFSEPSFGLQAGVGLLHAFGGVGPAVLPVLGLSYRPRADLVAALRVGGPAFAAELTSPAGTESVRQELAWLEVGYEPFAAQGIVSPALVLGGGVYRLDVAGAAEASYQSKSAGLTAALFDIGASARIRLGSRVSLLTAARLLWIAPEPIVRAAGSEIGTAGRPSLLLDAMADVAF